MIASVRPRTFLVIPRRAWRVLRSRSTQPEAREERARKWTLLESFEQMMNHQVRLMTQEFDA